MKFFWVITFYKVIIASKAAVVTKLDKSAPVKFSQFLANSLKSTSSIGDFFAKVFRISSLPYSSGNGTYNGLSILPGLRIAGSRISGLLLAAIINTYFPI